MKIKTKEILLVAASAMIFLTAYTLAYLSGSDFITNRFRGEQVEPVTDEGLKITVTEVFEPPTERSSEAFLKKVQIANTGSEDCYVRVRLEFSSSSIRDITKLSNNDDKDNESSYVDAAEYTDSALPEGWEYRPMDGYYYYTQPLPPGGSTVSLIKWVKTVFPENWEGAVDGYDIYVYSEAVPAEGENGEGLTYEEAWR